MKKPKDQPHQCAYQTTTAQLLGILVEIVPLLSQVQRILYDRMAQVEETALASGRTAPPKRKKPTPKRSRP